MVCRSSPDLAAVVQKQGRKILEKQNVAQEKQDQFLNSRGRDQYVQGIAEVAPHQWILQCHISTSGLI